MIDDDSMDPEWPDEDDEIVDDEAGRQAAARLRDQLELDLGEPSPAGKANRDDLLEFSIEQKNLRDAALITALNLSVAKSDNVVATIEILRRGIRFTRQKGSITCRAICPIVQAAPVRPDRGIEFGFPHRKLDHIGRGPTGDLKCTLDLNRALLSIQWGKTDLRFTPQQKLSAASPEWELQSPVCHGKIDPFELRKALAYVRLAAPNRRVQPGLAVVEVLQGQARAANHTELAIFEAAALDGMKLSVATEDVSAVCRVLSRLYPGRTRLFETETHYIITDDLVECTIKKPGFSLPRNPSMFSEPANNTVLVSQATLMEHLPMFSVLEHTPSIGKDTLIELESRLEGVSKLVLSTRAPDGSGAVLELESYLIDADHEREGWRIKVLAKQLFAALSYISETDLIEFGVVGNGKFLAVKKKDKHSSALAFLAARPDRGTKHPAGDYQSMHTSSTSSHLDVATAPPNNSTTRASVEARSS